MDTAGPAGRLLVCLEIKGSNNMAKYWALVKVLSVSRTSSMTKIDSLVKSRIGERHCLFRKKGFDTGGVNPPEADKLFEELATSSWNLAAGV